MSVVQPSPDNRKDWRDTASQFITMLRDEGPMTATDLHVTSNVARSTAYTILGRLCRAGNLVKEGTKYHVVRPLSAEPECDATESTPATVARILQTSAQETGCSAFLGQLRAGGVVISAWAQGERAPYIEDLEVGLHEACHATALGQALLATLPIRDLSRYLRRHLGPTMPKYTNLTTVDPDSLIGKSREASISGIHTEVGQFRASVACAAVVVNKGPRLYDRYAVATVLPTEEVTTYGRHVKTALHRTATQLDPWLLKGVSELALNHAEDSREVSF